MTCMLSPVTDRARYWLYVMPPAGSGRREQREMERAMADHRGLQRVAPEKPSQHQAGYRVGCDHSRPKHRRKRDTIGARERDVARGEEDGGYRDGGMPYPVRRAVALALQHAPAGPCDERERGPAEDELFDDPAVKYA